MFKVERTDAENLNGFSQASRAVLGCLLILIAMIAPKTPLGWLAVLPLVAVYPVFTAITGWNPVKTLYTKTRFAQRALHLSMVTRVVLAAVGVAAIGSVYVTPGVLSYMAVLPLLGIYPVFAAILGADPIAALYTIQVAGLEEETDTKLTLIKTGEIFSKHEDNFHKAA